VIVVIHLWFVLFVVVYFQFQLDVFHRFPFEFLSAPQVQNVIQIYFFGFVLLNP